MLIDIRNTDSITSIRFSDNDGGTAKATKLSNGVGGQLRIENESGDYLNVNYTNIDIFITALQRAKSEWHKP